ncbi:SNF2 family helicase [Mycena venus]|uniref:SNF2 family helicase n=1 Tax=Mycena venus TaxID=2733690 RepID=A0A8H6YBP9_9AGAR|nr:SNF2 family helicase [Mycena venus]
MYDSSHKVLHNPNLVRQIMYGVLYAISPEIFPAVHRGTGNALVSTATRVFGVIAPVIALYANLSTAVPVYISGALIISAGCMALLLPFEPRGKASMGKGKKRATSPASSATAKTRKRAKTSASTLSGGEADGEENFTWATMEYPKLHDAHFQAAVPAESIPVFSHTFEISYNNSVPQGPMPGHFATGKTYKEWISDERNLEETVELLCGPGESRKFDLGAVGLAEHCGHVVVISEVLHKRNDDAQWLLLLPTLPDELDFESLGIAPERWPLGPPNHDIFLVCYDLQKAGRVAINGHITLVMQPEGGVGEFPFTLQVQLTVSLTPAMFIPIPKPRNKSSPLEDCQRRFLQFVYPDPAFVSDSETVTNIPFFYSILGPAPHAQYTAADRAMQPEALLPTLLPFQRRSVAWLLDREGKTVTPDGQVVEKPMSSGHFSFWQRIEEANKVFFIHRVTGDVTPILPDERPGPGAILAEEPGLGKTLEVIGLILLSRPPPDRHPGVKRWDPEANVEVKAVKTTLIVTPPALATQWIDELKLHAPSLKVLVYEGWNKLEVPITSSDVEMERVRRLRGVSRGKGKGKGKPMKKGKSRKKSTGDSEDELDEDEAGEDIGEILDWCSYVQGFDVVITTYQTLKTDVNVARAPPKRPRREDVVYSNVEHPRSPLILVEWLRVVQMVGGGNVEDMVPMIPRLASFAVSGTPARTQVSDLMHVLKFLRVDHVVGTNPRHWARLAVPGYSNHFSAFFQSIAIRTTKASVTAELTIPQQTRYLVSIEMGRVERHVYDQNLEAILLDLGLDARGVDVRGEDKERQHDGALLRSSLRKLRAICTHPQIGENGNKLFKPGALKTMEQVLQIQSLIRMAQLQQHGDDKNRYQHCLETLLLAEKEATQLIKEIESAIATHEANRSLHQAHEPEPDPSTSPDEKGKGKERERSSSPLSDIESNEDQDHDGSSESSALKEHRAKRQALKQRLREAKLVMHRVKFLQGDAYHMLGASQSAAEDAAYGEAEKIRRAILKTSEKEATDAMALLARDVTSKGLTGEELQIDDPFLDYQFEKLRKAARSDTEAEKIAESVAYQEEANDIIENVLNQQSSLLWEWRVRLTELLTQQLTPGEEANGEEYQRTLDDQGEAETYLVNYTSLLADRREALLKERTLLAAHDAREKKIRHTKAAIKASAVLDTPSTEAADHIEMQPEHQVLHLELSMKRKGLVAALDGRAIKSVVVDMAAKVARMHKEDELKNMLKDAIADLRSLITEQGTLMDKLDADLALYRKAFNQRILYFRQLQEISDAVADVEFENTAAQALLECAQAQQKLATDINNNRAKQRFLDNLAKDKSSGEEDEDEKTCILCRCDFIRGFITHCAHIFCEECMKAWIAKRQGTCPVCRVAIDPAKLERFAVAEEPRTAPPNAEPVPKSRREIVYNMIGIVVLYLHWRQSLKTLCTDPEMFREIQAMPSFGDYGNKIQTLVRHLSYIRNVDPGAKSIVFSAWADSLFIVERALQENGILCLRIDQKRKGIPAVKQFASSEDINVLLLHGERENAGLNITCASRVFLLESVVHHGFEIQAIARIDRMGQKRPTEVFCYYAEDTIEKNILDLAARQGTSLYTKNNSVGSILNLSSLSGDGEKKKVDSPVKKMQKGDFIFKVDDMLQILFPHLFEDIEYLIPREEDGDVIMEEAPPTFPVNAVAGPSRLSH